MHGIGKQDDRNKIIGGIITFGIAPRLRSLAPKNGETPSGTFLSAQKWLGRLSGTTMVLGILVLFLITLI